VVKKRGRKKIEDLNHLPFVWFVRFVVKIYFYAFILAAVTLSCRDSAGFFFITCHKGRIPGEFEVGPVDESKKGKYRRHNKGDAGLVKLPVDDDMAAPRIRPMMIAPDLTAGTPFHMAPLAGGTIEAGREKMPKTPARPRTMPEIRK
jgi:hypothetical protein